MNAHLLWHVQHKIAHAMYFWQTLESHPTAALYVRLSFFDHTGSTVSSNCPAIDAKSAKNTAKLAIAGFLPLHNFCLDANVRSMPVSNFPR